MSAERAAEVRGLIEERMHGWPFGQSQIPYFPDMPTINMHRDKVVEFRNDYFILVNFASHVCGVKPDKLNGIHLIGHLLREETRCYRLAEALREMMEYVKESGIAPDDMTGAAADGWELACEEFQRSGPVAQARALLAEIDAPEEAEK